MVFTSLFEWYRKGRRDPLNIENLKEIAKILELKQKEKEDMIDMPSEDWDETPMGLPECINES